MVYNKRFRDLEQGHELSPVFLRFMKKLKIHMKIKKQTIYIENPATYKIKQKN